MKVLLISVNAEKDPYPVAPIGLAFIAKALKDNGHNTSILDLCFVDNDYKAIKESLDGFVPEVIGISIRNIDNLTYNKTIFYMPRIRGIVDFIKKHTAAPIVAGGSGYSIFPEDALRYLGLNTGIAGEGEISFPMFVDGLNSNSPVKTIPNLCMIEDGMFHMNDAAAPCRNSRADRSMLNNRMYLELGGMANFQTKRGCPFKCTYCTYPGIEGKNMRLKDPVDVADELKEMQSEYGIDFVFFVDDIFNFPYDHSAAICEEIIRNDLKISWTCFATPRGMTHELAQLMKLAGCRGIEFGSDAGSENTLNGLGKSFTQEDIAVAEEYCKGIDLPSAHYIIIGGPGETSATLNETLSFFKGINPSAVIALTGIRIYPNTALHAQAIDEHIIEKGTNLFEPVFYLTPQMGVDEIYQKVSEYAVSCNNWIVPSLDIQCDSDILSALRKLGKRGPLWDLLSAR